MDRSKFIFSVKGIESRRGEKVIKCTGTTTCKIWKKEDAIHFSAYPPRVAIRSFVSLEYFIQARSEKEFSLFCLRMPLPDIGEKERCGKKLRAPAQIESLYFLLLCIVLFFAPRKISPFPFFQGLRPHITYPTLPIFLPRLSSPPP